MSNQNYNNLSDSEIERQLLAHQKRLKELEEEERRLEAERR
jgi:hypothetical protein